MAIKKAFPLVIILLSASMLVSCSDRNKTTSKYNSNVTYQNRANSNKQKYTANVPNKSNSKAQAQYYRMLADQTERKIKSQEKSVAYAKSNLDKNPASSSAIMMYNSAQQLLQTYYKQRDQYLRLAIEAESK